MKDYLANTTQGTTLFYMAISQLTNNAHKLDSFQRFTPPVNWLLSCLRTRPDSYLEQIQKRIQPLYREAFLLNLLDVAMTQNAYYLVETILRKRVNINRFGASKFLNWALKHSQMTALEHVASHRRGKIGDAVAAGVRPIILLEPTSGFSINIACMIVDIFREEFAYTEDFVMKVLDSKDTISISLLLTKIQHKVPTYSDWLSNENICRAITRISDESIALKAFETATKVIFHECNLRDLSMAMVTDSTRMQKGMAAALNEATIEGRTKLLDFLVSATRSLESRSEPEDSKRPFANEHCPCSKGCFSLCNGSLNLDLLAAVKNGALSEISYLLKLGARPDHLYYRCVDENDVKSTYVYTPHSEALRLQSKQILQLFKGVTKRPYSLEHRVSLLIAASESADMDAIDELLPISRLEGIETRYLQAAYTVALSHSHFEVVHKLIDGGVELYQRHLSAAVKLRNIDLIRAMLSAESSLQLRLCDVSHVIELADADFLQEIMRYWNFDYYDKHNCDLLLTAVEKDNMFVVKYLLDSGVQLNSAQNTCSLDRSIFSQDFPIHPIRHRKTGCSWDTTNAYYDLPCTPFAMAILTGNLPMVGLLLDEGANLNRRSEPLIGHHYSITGADIYSALECAAIANDTGMIAALLSRGADPCDADALLALIRHENEEAARLIIDATNRSNGALDLSFRKSVLECAIQNGLMGSFQLLMRGANPTAIQGLNGKNEGVRANLLGIALLTDHPNTISMLCHLLEIDKDVNGVALILPRMHSEPPQISRKFWKHLPSMGSFTPMLCAIIARSRERMNILLDYGALINTVPVGRISRTPLQMAVKFGYVDIVTHLLQLGADINGNPAIQAGGTALTLAAAKGYLGISELLISKGADVNASAGELSGRTPFEAATEWGRLDMMLLLMRNGADLISSPNGERQYKRAVRFATANDQQTAADLAQDLQRIALEADAEAHNWDALTLGLSTEQGDAMAD